MAEAPRPLNRVVVGVDFSTASTAAAIWTARWLVPEAEVVLVHAIRPGDLRPSQSRSTSGRDSDSGADERSVEQHLRELGRGLSADFVWYEVKYGDATDAILAAATEFRADFVVTGMPDDSAPSSDGRESTIARLVRTSNVPVVMADGALERHPRRIVVLADDEAPAAGVMHCARALGAPHDAEVTVVSHTRARVTERYAARQRLHAPNDWVRRTVVRSPEYVPARRSPALARWRGPTPAARPDAPSDLEAAAHGSDEATTDLVVMDTATARVGTLPWLDSRVTAVLRRSGCPVAVVPHAWQGLYD
jgi:nucleotide-binding universal stress UspA family protein